MLRTFMQCSAVLSAFILFGAAEGPAEIADTSFFRSSPEEVAAGVVIIPSAEDRSIGGDVSAFTAALKEKNPKFTARLALNIVSAGPRLESGDDVKIGKLVRKDNGFTLAITYTSGRVRGVEHGKNIEWSPLAFVLVPYNLPAGAYTLKVTWQCSDEPAKGAAKPEDMVQETKFQITPAK